MRLIAKRNGGQVFVVSLWLLMILSVLAVGVGRRVSLAAHLSRFYRDRLEADLLAQAAARVAIGEILKDPDDTLDTLQDNWAENTAVFEHIALEGDPKAEASVSYVAKEQTREEIHYGVLDEQSKININAAPQELLKNTLSSLGIKKAKEVARRILMWRGDIPDDKKEFEEGVGYQAKGGAIMYLSELSLIEGLDTDAVEELRSYFTVWGARDLRVNINTVSREVLLVLAATKAEDLHIDPKAAESMTDRLLDIRGRKGYFVGVEDIDLSVFEEQEVTLLNALKPSMLFGSSHFLIVATGRVGTVRRVLQAVYDRPEGKIVYAHES